MNFIETLRSIGRKEQFQPTLIGFIINPVQIIRYGLFKKIKKFAPQIKGSVLDFGCGSKLYENLFINSDEYIGCDVEKSGYDHSNSKIDYFFDGKNLPFGDGTFDAVVSFEVFQHVFNLPEALKEINRVTKDSGTLLISIPSAYHEHELPYDFARYTSFGIVKILKDSGYEVIEYKKRRHNFLLFSKNLFLIQFCQLRHRKRFINIFFKFYLFFH